MEKECNEIDKDYIATLIPQAVADGIKRYVLENKRIYAKQNKKEELIGYYINEIARMNEGIRCYCMCLGDEIDTFRRIIDRYHFKVENSDEDYIDLLRKMVDAIIYRCGQLEEEITTFHIRVLDDWEEN